MKWIIQLICPKEESVFLVNPDTGSTRQISVPGADDAWIESDRVIIKSHTGSLWEVEPDNGSRRRILDQTSE